jgi:hypothetical protein
LMKTTPVYMNSVIASLRARRSVRGNGFAKFYSDDVHDHIDSVRKMVCKRLGSEADEGIVHSEGKDYQPSMNCECMSR